MSKVCSRKSTLLACAAAIAAIVIIVLVLVLTLGGREEAVEYITSEGITAEIANVVYDREDGRFTGSIVLTPSAEPSTGWENESPGEIAKRYSPSVSCGVTTLPLPVPGAGKSQNDSGVTVTLEFETWLRDVPEKGAFVEVSLLGFDEAFRIRID